jgi:dihydroxyacetone kinase-like protein
MKRGLSTIVEMRAELAALTPDAALQKIGMKLLSTIGGASGPLLASFFIAMAKAAQAVSQAFTTLAASDMPAAERYRQLKQTAQAGMLSTRDMIATKGRAAFLGERAIGHIDPGAKSCQIMIDTVCDLALKDAASTADAADEPR